MLGFGLLVFVLLVIVQGGDIVLFNVVIYGNI